MASFSPSTYVLCKAYVKKTLAGMGALKGAACQVGAITPTYDATTGAKLYSTITLLWEDNTGASHTSSFQLNDGRGIEKVVYNATMSTGSYYYYDVYYTDSSVTPSYFTIPASSTQMKKKILTAAEWAATWKDHPELADKNTIYMVETAKAGVYNQEISVWSDDSGAWEWVFLGSTEIDLTEYQHKIDSNIVKSYKNYDSTTSATQPTAPNVVGAINTFEKSLGITYDDASSTISNLTTTRLPGKFDTVINAVNQIGKLATLNIWESTSSTPNNLVDTINVYDDIIGADYDQTNKKINNLTTYRKTGEDDTLINAINQIGDLSQLENWSSTTETPATLVDAINIANADYELKSDTPIDRTVAINKYTLFKDTDDGSATIKRGTFEIPRVDVKLTTDSSGQSYRAYNVLVGGNLYDPNDTSQTAYGNVKVPTVKLQKVTPVPTQSKTDSIAIDSADWILISGQNYYCEKELSSLPVSIDSCVLNPAAVSVSCVKTTDKYVKITMTSTSGAFSTTATIKYQVDMLSAQYFLDIEGLGYDSSRCGVTIDIDKNSVFKDITLETVVTPDVPYPGAQVGDKYLDFWFVLADGTDKHTYVPCKDLFKAYTAENAINIDTNNKITLVITDPDSVTAITQDASGLRTYKATRTQYGVVEFATEAEVLAGNAVAGKTVGPYDLYNFIVNSTSVKGDLSTSFYKDSAGEIVNNTTLKAINELSTEKIRELSDAEKDLEDVKTYVLERVPVSGTKQQLGDTIHVIKAVIQVNSLSSITSPKDYAIYYLTTPEVIGTELKDAGLYMYVSGNWVPVSGSNAIRVEAALPTSDIRENVFYEIPSGESLGATFTLKKEYAKLGDYVDASGYHDATAGTTTDWATITTDWTATWLARFDSSTSGEVTQYTDSAGTKVDYKHYVSDHELWYRYNKQWKQVGPILKNYIIDSTNVIIDLPVSSLADRTTSEEDMTITVSPTGKFVVDYPLMYKEVNTFAASASVVKVGDERLLYYLNKDETIASKLYKSGLYKYSTALADYVLVGGSSLIAGEAISVDNTTNTISVVYDDNTIKYDSAGNYIYVDNMVEATHVNSLTNNTQKIINTDTGLMLSNTSTSGNITLLNILPNKTSLTSNETNISGKNIISEATDGIISSKETITTSGITLEHSENNSKLVIDSAGINLSGNVVYINGVDFEDTILESELDDITVKYDSASNLVYVPIDGVSILVNSSGEISANVAGVKPGNAIDIGVDSNGDNVIDVKFDNSTIILNSAGELESVADIFYAEYDVTTFAEIQAAVNNGKQVLLIKDGNLFMELTRIDNSGAHFGEQYIVVKYDGTKLLYWGQCDCDKSTSVWSFTSVSGVPNLDNQDTSIDVQLTNEDNIKVRRANKTILVDSEKKISTDGGIYVPIDEKTILFNDSEQLIAGPLIAVKGTSFADIKEAHINGRSVVFDDNYGTRYQLVSRVGDAIANFSAVTANTLSGVQVWTASNDGGTAFSTGLFDVQSKLYCSDGSLIFDTSTQGNNAQDIRVNIDNSTITFNSAGELSALGVAAGDAIELVEDSSGVNTVNVLFDDITIKLNSAGELISTGVDAGDAIELIDSNGVKTINVLFDNITVKLNSAGELTATGVEEGEAIELVDSNGIKTINVLYDNITIKLNSAGELISTGVDAGDAIELVDSNGIKTINVLFDDETVKVDSENKLYVPIDEKTIIIDSGKLCTRVGGWLEEGTSTVEVCVNGAPTTPTMYQSNWSLTSDFASITDKPDTFNVYLEGEMNLDTLGIVSFSEDVTMTKIAAGNLWDGTLNIGGDTFGCAIINDGLGTDELSLNNTSMHQIFASNLTASTANIGGSGIIHYIDNDYINIDNSTINLNSEGKLSASAVLEGKAIELVDSGNDKVINVLYDGVTVKLNSEGKLTSTGVEAGEAIKLVDSSGIKTINVLYDNSTIKLNSAGELTSTGVKAGEAIELVDSGGIKTINVLYDNSTIIVDSAGSVAVNIDNSTLLLNSEGKLGAVAVAKVDDLTTIANSEGEVQAVGLLKDSTININSYGGTNYTDIDISNAGIISYSTSNISHGVHNTVDDQTLNISGGSSFSSGGTIKLSGKSSSDNAGGILYSTTNGSNTFSITQKPTSYLTLTSADDVVVSMSDATRSLVIWGGTAYNNGSSITVSGKSDGNAGKLLLYAATADTTYNRLTIAPAGTTTYSTSATEAKVVNDVDTKYLTICGGTSTTGGAIQFYGKSSSSNAGMTQIYTNNGSNSQSWLIQPSGQTKITTSGNDAYFTTNASTHQMYFCGGSSTGDGGYIAIRGKSYSGQPGGLEIKTYNGSKTSLLKGYATGQLKWNGVGHGEDEVVTAHGFKIVTASTSISLSAGSSSDQTISLAGGTGWAFLAPLPCGSSDGIFSLMVGSYSGVGTTTGSITWVARNNGGNSHSTTIITRGLFVRTDGSYANGY